MSSRKTPKHLWSGDWRSESEQAGRPPAGGESTSGRPESPPPAERGAVASPAPPGGRRRAKLAGAALLAGVAVAGAFVAGDQLGEGGGGARTTAALPAVSATPIKPPAGQTQAGAIYARASPAVVSVRTASGSGTGFLIDEEGTIVTNAHVVDKQVRVTIRFGAEGADLRGEVAGTDPSSDLAVIRMAATDVPSAVEPLRIANSDGVAVGDSVIAIGNPFGLDRTETAGIVSGIGRNIQAPNGFQISEAIQTDAAINPGNSGGPLLDDAGQVIGVNSQIETSGASSGNVGVGFAVPSNTLRRVVPALRQGRTIERPWLGLSTMDNPGGDGARVAEVVPGSPADDAGLRAGDIITSLAGEAVKRSSSLGQIVEAAQVGEDVVVEVQRGLDTVEIDATLRARPEQAP